MRGMHDTRDHSITVWYSVNGYRYHWTSDYARTHGERAAAMLDYFKHWAPDGFVPLYSHWPREANV